MLPNSIPSIAEDEESGMLTSPIGLTAGGAGGSGHIGVGSSSPPPLGAVTIAAPTVDLDVEPSPEERIGGLTVLANGGAERSAIATPVIPPRVNVFEGLPLGDGGVGAAGGANGNGTTGTDVAAAAAAAAALYSPARAPTGAPGDGSPATGRRRRGSRTSATGVAASSPGFGRRLSRGLSRGQSLIKSKLAESWPYVAHMEQMRANLRAEGGPNGTLSPAELRAGLASLGFDVASASHMALLQRELDKENAGVIRESQFIHVFRSLNRAAIEAKLRAGAAAAAQSKMTDEQYGARTSIQLIKLKQRVQLDQPDAHDLGVSFSRRDVPVGELADVLRAEEEFSTGDGDGGDGEEGRAPPIRWIDVCGFHEGVLDLISNFYLLPHEMLGDEIELETAAHADFYSGRPNAKSNATGAAAAAAAAAVAAADAELKERGVDLEIEDVNIVRAASAAASDTASRRPPSPTSAPPNRRHPHFGDEDDSGDVEMETLSSRPATAAGVARTASQMRRSDSVGAAPSNCTLKILVHSIQLRNFPIVDEDENDDDDSRVLISKKKYLKTKPYLQSTPVHIVVANEHTLITVRPWVAPAPADSSGSLSDADDPNRMFDELIQSLSDTDPTSRSSTLGLTSSLQLLMRVWEDVTDSNWSVRDLMKEWKIYLGDHVDDISGPYHTLMLNDLDRLAGSLVRLLKPLVATTAALSEQETQHAAIGMGASRSYGAQSVRSMVQATARSTFLLPISPALRLLHRAVLRQFEQATLTLSLVKVLHEQFIQRGRDKSNDTLYLLTVVTTIVTPLQIMAGVYGMNFDNFPELHYENAYYWFWGLNAVVIVLIGLGFHFKRLL